MFQVVMTKETEGSLNNQLILNDLKLVHPATAWKMKQLFRYLRTFEKIRVRLSRFMGAINPKKIVDKSRIFFRQVQKNFVNKSQKKCQKIQEISSTNPKNLWRIQKKIVNKSKKNCQQIKKIPNFFSSKNPENVVKNQTKNCQCPSESSLASLPFLSRSPGEIILTSFEITT